MTLTLAGSLLGTLFGLAHARYVYKTVANARVSGEFGNSQSAAGYYAFWTLALWVLFGTYLLVFWLASVIFYTVFKLWR